MNREVGTPERLRAPPPATPVSVAVVASNARPTNPRPGTKRHVVTRARP